MLESILLVGTVGQVDTSTVCRYWARYVMYIGTLLLLGMYVADCAVCRSHTHRGGRGVRGVYVYVYVYVP